MGKSMPTIHANQQTYTICRVSDSLWPTCIMYMDIKIQKHHKMYFINAKYDMIQY